MGSIAAIAVSGLQAAQVRLQAHAHNIANLGTADFRRSQVSQTALPAGGTQARMGRMAQPGAALADDMVGQLQARNGFLANLAVFKTQDQMAGALLDAVG